MFYSGNTLLGEIKKKMEPKKMNEIPLVQNWTEEACLPASFSMSFPITLIFIYLLKFYVVGKSLFLALISRQRDKVLWIFYAYFLC